VFVSAAPAWKISAKHRLDKLPGAAALAGDFDPMIVASRGFFGLPISLRHGQAAGMSPGPRRDPFDRMLIAQAMIEELRLVSNERVFDAYGVARLW
jgi:PIN domain nuclease of toxin-antitoxin system